MKLLLDEHPLVVLPSLAVAAGLNEAILLQQVHYWSLRSTNEADGHLWVYNTAAGWREQFPFWSESTIKRTIASLREAGLLVVRRSPHNAMDRTNWYRIDYERLGAVDASGQIDPMGGSDCTDAPAQADPMSTETTAETTSTPPPENARESLFADEDDAPAGMADAAAALRILEEVPRANGSPRPTLEAVERVQDRYPGLALEAVARDLDYWARHGNGARKTIKSVMGTFANFAKFAERDRQQGREPASPPPGTGVPSGADSDWNAGLITGD